MKNIYLFTFFTLIIGINGCVPKKKTVAPPIKFEAPQPVIQAPADNDSLVPFTRDIYNRLRQNNLDIRKLQFFVDQTIVLSRGVDQGNIDIQQGRIVNKVGINENKIELLALTPGVVEAIEPDGLRVSFEQGSNLKFINNKYSPEFFIFSGANWDNKGTAEVNYKGTVYRASCGTCGSVADAKLVVRQKDIDNSDTKVTTLPGRRIN